MNYLSGNPERVPKLAITKDGIPECLGSLIIMIRRSESPECKSTLALLNTILFCTRALSIGRRPDISPIIDPIEAVFPFDLIENIGKYAVSFFRDLGYRLSYRQVPKPLVFKKFHLTTKAGPNGQALWSSLTDFYSLPESLKESICQMGGAKMARIMSWFSKDLVRDGYFKHLPFGPELEKSSFRKLSYFPDREDKVRVIAIIDY